MKILSAATALLGLLFSASVLMGQTVPGGPRDCQAAALDATLAFANPPGEHQVAINYRNISDAPCVMGGGTGAMFDNWHEGHNIWAKECRNCGSDGWEQPARSLVLAPGEGAYFLLRWKSVSDGSEPCTDSDGFNTSNVTVVAPSLLDRVCSVVEERSFLLGFFGTSRPDSGADPGAQVELSAPDSVLYAGDSFPFRAVIRDPKDQLVLDDHSCPVTFIRTRDASGGTMFHQISGFSPRCRIVSFGAGRMIEMELRAPGLGVLNIPGSTSVRFYVLTGPGDAREVALAASNSLQMKIVDPATLAPNWGPEAAGVAISLVLDKEAYKTGEDVPLRINLENFRATQEIGSGELPCGAGVTIDVRDSSGVPVPQHGLGWFCTGHGWQTVYPLGKPVLVPRITLGSVRLLPEHPGTYTVTATWEVNGFVPGDTGREFGRPLQPYAIVHSQPTTFRVVPERY